VSVDVLTHVFKHSRASGNDRLVLLVLADHASDDGSGSYPSQTKIAEKANVTDRTVRACLRRLEGMGEITRHGVHPSHKTVIYDLNLSLTLETSSARKNLPARKPVSDKPSSVSVPSSASSSRSTNNGSRKGGRSTSRLVARAREVGFDEWLSDHAQVTSMTPPRAGTKALGEIASRFRGLIEEGYSLEELKLATRGAYANEHRRANGYIGAENVLRPTKIHGLIENGRRARNGELGKSVPGEHPADRRIRENLKRAGVSA